MKTLVYINEQHTILEQQSRQLKKAFGDWSVVKIPAKGWSLQRQNDEVETIKGFRAVNSSEQFNVVFISPIPFLLASVSAYVGSIKNNLPSDASISLYLFHNNIRDKKELNGRIVEDIPNGGWQLVKVV